MNKKTREAIETLIQTASMQTFHPSGAHKQAVCDAIAAAEKLLNPPVRFAWVRDHTGAYKNGGGSTAYTIRRVSNVHGNSWRRTVSVYADDTVVDYHPTLAAAKQACVDHGVARAQAKRHTGVEPALFDNARHFNGTLRPSAGPMGGPGAGPARGSQP